MKPSISLVIATHGRVDTLDRLFSSIEMQAWPNLECIIVDQNEDARLKQVLAPWQSRLPLRVLRLAPHLSQARNRGLEEATGDIVAFPDDDCWYSEGIFAKAAEFFAKHKQYNILTVGIRDEHDVPSGNRWVQEKCELASINIFRTTATYGCFFRRDAIGAGVRFDEKIGPNAGTAFGCGEDTDFVLQALDAGARGFFDGTLWVHHPRRDMLSGSVSQERAVRYGMGMGHVLAKHRLTTLWCSFLAYDFIRAVVCIIRLKSQASRLCVAHARGVWAGYVLTMQEFYTKVGK